jgi:hypothetical protein
MPVEGVALIPQVHQVEAAWLPADEERWRAYLGGDELDQPAELFFYCPTCAEREFGDELRRLAREVARPRRTRAPEANHPNEGFVARRHLFD